MIHIPDVGERTQQRWKKRAKDIDSMFGDIPIDP
jgi:hypothetical protein